MPAFRRKNSSASKVTEAQVYAMRQAYESGRVTQGQLCRDYGLSIAQVGRIVRYESWADARPPVTPDALADSAQRLFAGLEEETEAADRLAAGIQAAKDEASGANVERMLEELAEGGEAERAAAERLKGL